MPLLKQMRPGMAVTGFKKISVALRCFLCLVGDVCRDKKPILKNDDNFPFIYFIA